MNKIDSLIKLISKPYSELFWFQYLEFKNTLYIISAEFTNTKALRQYRFSRLLTLVGYYPTLPSYNKSHFLLHKPLCSLVYLDLETRNCN